MTAALASPLAVVVLLQDELKDEVRDMAKRLGSAGLQLLVIDTGERSARGKQRSVPQSAAHTLSHPLRTALSSCQAMLGLRPLCCHPARREQVCVHRVCGGDCKGGQRQVLLPAKRWR